jgi:hypothetical protein
VLLVTVRLSDSLRGAAGFWKFPRKADHESRDL